MRSTVAGYSRLFHTRARAALRSARGAFDLPSIIAGVVVVGILTAGVLAAVFGVIPFAQDNGAKQDLSAVRTAEGVAKAKDGRFMDTAGLEAAGYVKNPVAAGEAGADGFTRAASVVPARTFAVETDADGTCYVSVSKSPTSKLFLATSTAPDPAQLHSGDSVPSCITQDVFTALIDEVGGPGDATASPSASPSAPAGSAVLVSFNKSSTTSGAATFTWAAASGATGYRVESSINAGAWNVVSDNQPGTTATVTAVSGSSIQLRVATWTGSTMSAYTTSSPTSATTDVVGLAGWGWNQYGSVGDNTTTETHVPVQSDTTGVLAGKTITALATATFHSCAIADGEAYCWGSNGFGKLGIGTTVDGTYTTPQKVQGLAGKTVTAISVSGTHTCLVASGAAYCSGNNYYGQLGTGGTTGVSGYTGVMTPVAQAQYKLAGKTVTDIAAGSKHSCAVADAAVFCWGNRTDAALGDFGGNTGIQPTPVSVPSTNGATQVSAGGQGTCATINSKAYCWGSNTYREVGNGTTTPAWRPSEVLGITGAVTKVVTGANATCAVADGRAYCWGYDQKGELGILNPGATKVALPVTALDGTTVTDISLGSATTCAIADGSAYCWGYNSNGQVGDGTTTDQWLPVKILDGGVKVIATGSRETLALRNP